MAILQKVAAEISSLEKKKEDLEDELKMVNRSLTSARARLHNTKEEREQFDEASHQIDLHLKTKEDELSRSIASCRAESDVVNTWINFLEDTWILQSSYIEQTDMHAKRSKIASIVDSESPKVIYPQKKLEQEYLESESKIVAAFALVDNIKQQAYTQEGIVSKKDDPRVKELLDAVEPLRKEFECIEKPKLEMETSPRSWAPSGTRLQKSQQSMDPKAELSRLQSELGKGRKTSSTEDIGDLDFDQL
ncbi:hypothetical protein GIB67_038204 [Kingdonia uniflora]|uniref:Uncharacterized protein n=1 Tax=Kingdonia uniflora TaxID=39325 RepID=A0A7J7NH38_9MAGN|nr:hypothetical protein GIB67_038204 [Kingdonia uniflora]